VFGVILRKSLRCTLLFLFTFCSICGISDAAGIIPVREPAIHGTPDSARAGRQRGPLLLLNRFYKNLIADQLSSSCEFDPSCSVFSRQALSRFGPFKGLCLTTDRLTRCHGNAHGEVPEYFANPLTARLLDSIQSYDAAYLEQYAQLSDTGVHKLPFRSPALAVLLSSLVPGTGKYYLGYPYQATSSLITNLFLGGAATEMLLLQPHSLLPVFGFALFSTFYAGNVWGTAILVKKRKSDHYYRQMIPATNRTAETMPEVQDTATVLNHDPGPGETAAGCFRKADYNGTYAALLRIPDSVIIKSDSLLRLKILTLIALGRFEESKAALLAVAQKDNTMVQQIQALPVTSRRLSPSKAYRLGGFFPGLGQVYAGYPGKAFISLILQAGCAGAVFLCWRSGMYLTGTVYGLYPLIRFYQGGKINGRTLAEKRNRKREEALAGQYREILDEVLKNRWLE